MGPRAVPSRFLAAPHSGSGSSILDPLLLPGDDDNAWEHASAFPGRYVASCPASDRLPLVHWVDPSTGRMKITLLVTPAERLELERILPLDLETLPRVEQIHAFRLLLHTVGDLEEEIEERLARLLPASALVLSHRAVPITPRDLSSGGTGKFAAEGPPPPDGSIGVDQPIREEPTGPMPTWRRWWDEKWRRWTEETRGLSPATRGNRLAIGRRLPIIFERVGFDFQGRVSRAMVEAVKAEGRYTSGTLAETIGILRGYLRWSNDRLADDAEPWQVPNVVAVNRRWLRREQLADLLEEAFASTEERERFPVYLAGANGLRIGEIVRLTVGHARMDLAEPTLTVLGKGRRGGKWRTIGMSPLVWDILLPAVQGRRSSDRVYSFAYRTADMDIRNVGRRVGIPNVSAHDLRRTFGRLYFEDTKDLVGLQHIYGHESVEMTAYYIGLDLTQMATGLRAHADSMRAAIAARRAIDAL